MISQALGNHKGCRPPPQESEGPPPPGARRGASQLLHPGLVPPVARGRPNQRSPPCPDPGGGGLIAHHIQSRPAILTPPLGTYERPTAALKPLTNPYGGNIQKNSFASILSVLNVIPTPFFGLERGLDPSPFAVKSSPGKH